MTGANNDQEVAVFVRESLDFWQPARISPRKQSFMAFPVGCSVLVHHLVERAHVADFPSFHELRHDLRISRQAVNGIGQILLVLSVIHSTEDLRLVVDRFQAEHRFASSERSTIKIDVYAELLAESRHVEGARTERLRKKPRPVPFNLFQRKAVYWQHLFQEENRFRFKIF